MKWMWSLFQSENTGISYTSIHFLFFFLGHAPLSCFSYGFLVCVALITLTCLYVSLTQTILGIFSSGTVEYTTFVCIKAVLLLITAGFLDSPSAPEALLSFSDKFLSCAFPGAYNLKFIAHCSHEIVFLPAFNQTTLIEGKVGPGFTIRGTLCYMLAHQFFIPLWFVYVVTPVQISCLYSNSSQGHTVQIGLIWLASFSFFSKAQVQVSG